MSGVLGRGLENSSKVKSKGRQSLKRSLFLGLRKPGLPVFQRLHLACKWHGIMHIVESSL